MVWYDLRIGDWKLRITPVKTPVVEHPDCDKDGNIVQRDKGTYTPASYKSENGTNYEKNEVFKLIKGKAMRKLSKTKELSVAKEVPASEAEDLMTTTYYYIDNDE